LDERILDQTERQDAPESTSARRSLMPYVTTLVSLALLAGVGASTPTTTLAQAPCIAESEPNDTEQEASSVAGPLCIEGTLSAGDQDLAVWELTTEHITTHWTVALEGVVGTENLLQFYTVTSEPSQPLLTVDRTPILTVVMETDDPGPALAEGVLLPGGRYLVATTRSALPGGGEPENLDYRLRIEPGETWPPNADVEPNDDAATAVAVTDAFEVSGDRQGTRGDFYAWSITQPGLRWELSIAAPIGETAQVDLQSADGRRLDQANAATQATLYDLALDPGSYIIRVPESGDGARPYVLTATQATADGDPEPNDETLVAVPIADGGPIRGRLAKEGDKDRFSLTVPVGDAMLRDVRMLWRSGTDRTLCLLDKTDTRVVCGRAAEGLALPNLHLAPGDHTFEVSGTSDVSDTYLLRVDVTGPVVPVFETEPNDEILSATDLDPSLGMTARGGPEDDDVFRVAIDGEPQLWQIDVAGSAIRRADMVSPRGVTLASADIASDGSSATLADLYLVPGEHWLRVSSSGIEYAVQATALGPPDPDGEREPNDESLRAQRYRIGARRVGRLPTMTDRDVYRFTLAAPQHVELDVVQPEDAQTTIRVSSGDEILSELAGLPMGDRIRMDLWLEPGDHLVEMLPEQASTGTYELTSSRLDPFEQHTDKEPNDGPLRARPVPASLSWSGEAADADDEDWYIIPPLTEPGELRIDVDADARVRLTPIDAGEDFGQPIQLDERDDGVLVATEPPRDKELFLSVAAAGSYDVRLEGAGLVASTVAETPPIELTLTASRDDVAAYWPEEQVLEAELAITNNGPTDIQLDLDTVTSHYLWGLTLETETVSVPGGATRTVPAMIIAGADAWAEEPVQITVRARTDVGGQVSTSAQIDASREVVPADTRPGWPLPTAVLGGLNAASHGLGATPGGTLDADRERHLFDGVTPDGGGFSIFVPDYVDGLPLELTVDLAGDSPMPVVATIINPQASDGHLDELPRDFELLLSDDGVAWQTALAGSISPLPIDQVFLLDEPKMASHAMLRIWSTHAPVAYMSLGEWKVVAAPGTAVGSQPINIADPERGGHIITLQPFDDDAATGVLLLDEDPTRVAVDLKDVRRFGAVIGFQDGRAAQVESLEWSDPQGTSASERLQQAVVFVSMQGPTGPWRLAGAWDLARASDGSVTPFAFEDPMWARYLRLTGVAPLEAEALELPATLRVIERATDADYRSILGEWGYRSARGPYEWLASGEGIAWDPAIDAGDSVGEATAIAAGDLIADRVEINVDEDWYHIEIPADHNTFDVAIEGVPTIGTQLTLLADDGSDRPMTVQRSEDGGLDYRADVEPGASYSLRIHQPPFSAAFAFDTSPSMDPFLDMVVQGMRSFLADVQPGREVVTVLPFEEPALVDSWQDDPYVLQDAFDNHVVEGNGSSGAEAGLIAASGLLASRDGARAVLLVTDAETSTFDQTSELWEQLASVRPIIFSVHIGATEQPVVSRQLMQDWAASGGGHYAYPTTHGEMDRAFDRMATWLRRPAAYTLRYETLDLQPARLAIKPPSDPDGRVSATVLAPGVGVEIILDTSSSMRKRLGKKRRIDIAKASLRSLIGESLAEGVPVAIRTFGGPSTGKGFSCDTTLTLPLAPLDRATALRTVKRLKVGKKTATPIAAALEQVAQDLASVNGLRSVVLVTDGKANCGGDPAEAIAALKDAGIDVKLDIIGFALKDEALKEQMGTWASAAGGTYRDAASASALATSIATALSAPFRVYGSDGEAVASGTVSGEGIELEPGDYRVEVLTDPPFIFDDVELGSGASVTLELPGAETTE
jgi:Mg-chelatase subunit ChlD